MISNCLRTVLDVEKSETEQKDVLIVYYYCTIRIILAIEIATKHYNSQKIVLYNYFMKERRENKRCICMHVLRHFNLECYCVQKHNSKIFVTFKPSQQTQIYCIGNNHSSSCMNLALIHPLSFVFE